MQKFTVVFFIDADKAVETFVEQVIAKDPSEAFEKAKRKARRSGCSTSGHSIPSYCWENATEIATFYGHDLDKAPTPLAQAA